MKDMKTLLNDPVIKRIAECRELFWDNPHVRRPYAKAMDPSDMIVDTDDADARLRRFAPYIERLWPETEDGIIESPLVEIDEMQVALGMDTGGVLDPVDVRGKLLLKCDSHLPISGSIKARGGIYEVLKFAEEVAIKSGKLSPHDNYSKLADEEFRELFSEYSVAVGSTGNLGLSIGIISAALGFKVTVHMSADARQWKKDMLRSKGVIVREYPDDYEAAVAQGRREAEADPGCHFVDDENSLDLFAGYSVAGRRLKKQFEEMDIKVDGEHPLCVYLPCGVGGAPGGVTYGLKEVFGDDVYCFFAEPTHAPCMTLGLASGLGSTISVKDVGIDGITVADGLAVGRPSRLVAEAMKSRLDGCFTVDDSRLYPILSMLRDTEEIFIEPSACAGFAGLRYVMDGRGGVPAPDENATHVVWATGGAMVPEDEKIDYYKKGYELLRGSQGE